MAAPHPATDSTRGSYPMTAKKRTPAATAASKSRKAAKPKELAVATPQLETLPTLAPPVEPAPNAVTTGDVPVPADPVPPGPLADTPAVTVADQPQVETEPPAPHAAAIPESTLRLWQVRRGPEILGQVQAGTITWAKKQACKQFGDNLTVEPGTEVPT